MGCISEYASHCVSLWKGTRCSHGSEVEVVGMEESGQASPRETPSITVREAGQIGARPSIRTCQRVGIGTMRTDEAWVVGWEMR